MGRAAKAKGQISNPLAWLAVAVSAVLASTVMIGSPAAAIYYSGGMYSANWQVKPYGFNSTWTTPNGTHSKQLEFFIFRDHHELGHSLSLGDNPSSGNASLMNHDRDRTLVYGPKTVDINEVNGYY